ncbi:hypothetical protein AX16_009120 [Volvariella volvacea WC 439]|nr:hypothetical protein AX16_009120 [Volvariella volvacea WC 439]
MAYQQQQPPMQYQQHPGQPQQIQQRLPQEVVPLEQYNYALTNFRLAHEKVEQQRQQLEEQEKLNAQLRARIALLEGGSEPSRHGKAGNTVDDFSIRNAASQLDKLINRWAAEVVRNTTHPLTSICEAIVNDVGNGVEYTPSANVSTMQLQSYLRHAISETISEGIINCLIVTNSSEANVQLTRIHEHIFARDPTVASVWRRQTFSAAVEQCTPDMTLSILHEHVPELMKLLDHAIPAIGGVSVLESAYSFSRMLHSSGVGMGDAFYRAFVPELGSTLYPRQIELVKRCLRSERGEPDRVGATIFPGLVKVTRGPLLPNGKYGDNVQTVVRRAQVICECALNGHGAMQMGGMMDGMGIPGMHMGQIPGGVPPMQMGIPPMQMQGPL